YTYTLSLHAALPISSSDIHRKHRSCSAKCFTSDAETPYYYNEWYREIWSEKMDRIIVKGGRKLSGSVEIEGAKNAVLPILAASLLAGEGRSIIKNVPELSDVNTLTKLITRVGAKASAEKNSVVIDASGELNCVAPYE